MTRPETLGFWGKMAGMDENELAHKLFEAGKRLEHPPQSKDDLVQALEKVEDYLSMVEQSPSEIMQDAVLPSMSALVKPELLRHQDKDVRLIVVTCISEITRITAPEAPYNDDLMREIFQLIVGSFQGLDQMNSPTFGRRVTILETVAKVRSCVVMLDLECDDLILEMFQHFLASASENHTENVSASMQTIMTLVLDESEDISQQLLSVLLTSLRRDKQEASPAALALAVNVVKRCAEKLRPYLTAEMSAEGASQSDFQKEYHEIIYDICQQPLHLPLPNVSSTVQELQPDGSSAPGSVVGNDVQPNAQGASLSSGGKVSPDVKGLIRNEDNCVPEGDKGDHKDLQKISDGNAKEAGKENISHDLMPPGIVKASKGRRSTQARRSTTTPKVELDKSLDSKILESGKPTGNVREGRKSRRSETMPDTNKASNESVVGNDVQSLSSSKRKRGKSGKESKNSAPLDQPKKETVGMLSPGGSDVETLDLAASAQSKEVKVASPTQSSKDTVNPASPDRSSKEAGGLASPALVVEDLEGPVAAAQSSKMEEGLSSPTQSTKDNEGLVSLVPKTKDGVGSPSPEKSSKEKVGLASPTLKDDGTVTDSSRSKRGRTKFPGKTSDTKEESVLPGSTAVVSEDVSDLAGAEEIPAKSPSTNPQLAASTDSEAKVLKRPKRKLDTSNVSTPKPVDKNLHPIQKESRQTDTPDENQDDVQRPKKMQKVTSIQESAEKDVVQAGESSKRTPRSSAKRKSVSVLEKTPGTADGSEEAEKLVGRKIKVWWPQDKQFYNGIIESFDTKLKKHKVVYVDGDVEVLNLQKQRFEFIDENPATEKSPPVIASSKPVVDKSAKRRTTKGESPPVKEDVTESSTKRGSHSSKSRKESRSQSDVKPDNNGALVKSVEGGLSEKDASETIADSVMAPENIDQPTSGSRARKQKQGGESRKGRQVTPSSTPTDGTVKRSKGTRGGKSGTDQDKTGISSDGGARNSDDEPLNTWRSRSRSEQ